MISTNYFNFTSNSVNFGNNKVRAVQNMQPQKKILSNLDGVVDKNKSIIGNVKIDGIIGLAKNTVLKAKKLVTDEFVQKVEKLKTPEEFQNLINNTSDINELKYLKNCVKSYAGFYGFGCKNSSELVKSIGEKSAILNISTYKKEGYIINGIEMLEYTENLPADISKKLEELSKRFDNSDGKDFNEIMIQLDSLIKASQNL